MRIVPGRTDPFPEYRESFDHFRSVHRKPNHIVGFVYAKHFGRPRNTLEDVDEFLRRSARSQREGIGQKLPVGVFVETVMEMHGPASCKSCSQRKGRSGGLLWRRGRRSRCRCRWWMDYEDAWWPWPRSRFLLLLLTVAVPSPCVVVMRQFVFFLVCVEGVSNIKL